ncbi:MAG: type II toxin-antitoxin system VapC family toxin [Candidatus Obscuribacterales bacterium]|jgi:PIN domain nuclease of toxin-antitoxin system|nr:type II toxin-antitoxin system VapC family toxin [Candidatus Obscuribacterales bacterium]
MSSSILVTDTHPLVWYVCGESRKLPKKVKAAFDDAVEGRRAIFIPHIVLWEFALVIKSGKVRLDAPLDEYVRERFFAKSISILELETEDILHSNELNFTSDPFDALIVAMAKRMDCPLITGDSVIHSKKPCQLFW